MEVCGKIGILLGLGRAYCGVLSLEQYFVILGQNIHLWAVAASLSMPSVSVLVHGHHMRLLQNKGLGWEGVGKGAHVLLEACQHQTYSPTTNLVFCTVTELQMENHLWYCTIPRMEGMNSHLQLHARLDLIYHTQVSW